MATYSRVGLRDLIFCPLTTDTESTLTYGATVEPETVEAIEVTISNQNTDPNVQYANDIEAAVLYEDTELTVNIKVMDLPLTLAAKLLGNLVDDNGVMIEVAGATRPYYAIGFKSEKRDGNDRYVWLLKGRAKPMDETHHTKEKTATRQTDTISMTFIKRTNDGAFKHILDSEDVPVLKDPASFFTSVYSGTLQDR